MIGGAGAGKARDQLLEDPGPQLPRADVIQKEKRFRAENGDVVDAMIDEVLADGVVAVQGEGDFQLGAHAVGAGDQDRLAEFLGVEGKQAAEAAHVAEHLAAAGGGEQAGQRGLDFVAQADVHAGGGISFLLHLRGKVAPGAPPDKGNFSLDSLAGVL